MLRTLRARRRPSPPSVAARRRLADEVLGAVAEARYGLEESTLRSEGHLHLGQPDQARRALDDQSVVIHRMHARIQEALAAAAVEREAEWVLAAVPSALSIDAPDGEGVLVEALHELVERREPSAVSRLARVPVGAMAALVAIVLTAGVGLRGPRDTDPRLVLDTTAMAANPLAAPDNPAASGDALQSWLRQMASRPPVDPTQPAALNGPRTTTASEQPNSPRRFSISHWFDRIAAAVASASDAAADEMGQLGVVGDDDLLSVLIGTGGEVASAIDDADTRRIVARWRDESGETHEPEDTEPAEAAEPETQGEGEQDGTTADDGSQGVSPFVDADADEGDPDGEADGSTDGEPDAEPDAETDGSNAEGERDGPVGLEGVADWRR